MSKSERINNLETRVNFLIVEVQRLSREIEKINRLKPISEKIHDPVAPKVQQNWIPLLKTSVTSDNPLDEEAA